jgi:arsenate reductase-like glutaredoxin family protein
VQVDERDINRTPPNRAFLERHVDAGHFLDFLSRRSPVFRNRPLPTSKKEAIDLMLAQPNLIRRPVLVSGAEVIFGFDRDRYQKLGRR